MQIHELSTFSGTPTSSDYLAIDNSTTTTKIGATSLGVQTKMTVAEAETGTSTGSRIITPQVLHDYVNSNIPNITDVKINNTSLINNGIANILEFEYKASVTASYAEDNLLHFQGLAINPNRNAGHNFLVIMTGGAGISGESMYLIVQNPESAGSTYKDVLLSSNGANYPQLSRTTTTSSVYVVWTSTRTAAVEISIILLR